MVQLSVNFSIRGGGDNVKLLGEIISAFSPRDRSSPQMGEWTRRDSNPHLRFDRELCYPLHHGPSREFREARGSLQGCESQQFWSISIGEAGQHAENEVNVASVPEFPRFLLAPLPLRVPHPCVFCKGGVPYLTRHLP